MSDTLQLVVFLLSETGTKQRHDKLKRVGHCLACPLKYILQERS